MKINKLELIGITVTIIGGILSFVGDYIDSKMVEQIVDERIKDALAEHDIKSSKKTK